MRRKKRTDSMYDWDELLTLDKRRKTKSFVLARGIHYSCSQSSICQQLRNAATKLGVYVGVTDCQDSIYVTVSSQPIKTTTRRRVHAIAG